MDARTIEVIRRSPGYLSLRFPPAPPVLNERSFGTTLARHLESLPGVIQAAWIPAEGKLIVRFDPASCSHADVAIAIKARLPETLPGAATAESPAPADSTAATSDRGPGLAASISDLRDRVLAATPARFRPIIDSATTEKAVTNFFNDIVAFYLIKVHWDLIVNRWIKDPARYGNAWLSVFYLVFLLVRYRKS